ncbi:programmed cell death 1 ligand 1-like isoform X5 [Trachinotus anak]|uniref:programmed cell death 1 ligand 1-like isoform X5 n=1 Tax=Trachinotus anak TaxID=443729 RepID=UPI0039F22868
MCETRIVVLLLRCSASQELRSAQGRMSFGAVGASLLVTVTVLCLTVGETPFTVSVPQDVYQEEEHGNVTLKWLFPVQADMAANSLFIDVMYVSPFRRIYLYDSTSGAEEYPDELYKGRVRCDPELIWKGQIECVFTGLRLSDTGTYGSVVVVGEQSSYRSCDLNVTATSDQTVPNESSKPESRGRIGLCSAGLSPVEHLWEI